MNFSSSLARLPLALLLAAAAIFGGCHGSADLPQPESATPAPVAPAITTQPESASVQVGQTASFSVVATGTAPLAYQWQRNGVNVSGATGASFTTPATVAGDNGAVFAVVISNAAGSVTSNNAMLTVTAPASPSIAITQQPASITVVSGATAAFAVAATCSAGSVTWQWQRSNDGGSTWTSIAGATLATYSFTAAVSDNASEFEAIASCGGSTLTTDAATLTVTAAGTTATLSELPVGLQPAATLGAPSGIVTSPSGAMIFADAGINQIRQLANGVVTSIAGSYNSGSADGTGAAARFKDPRSVAVGSDGTIFVADTGNDTIRQITPAGVVTTLAGTAGTSGSADGNGSAAQFSGPTGITFGSDGALYVVDAGNFTIRRVTLAGVVTTLAGTPGVIGKADGTGAAARFAEMQGSPAADGNGNLYIADTFNNLIRKVTLGGVVTTLAGNGLDGANDGVGTAAGIPFPGSIAVAGGSLYITSLAGDNGGPDTGYGQIRKIDLSDNSVTTISGQAGGAARAEFLSTRSTLVDGPIGEAEFSFADVPSDIENFSGITVGGDGALYVTDYGNGALRKIDSSNITTTLVHRSSPANIANGFEGVTLDAAAFGDLQETLPLALDASGNVLVADTGADDIRSITPAGAVSLIAGLHDVPQAYIDGKGSGALFYNPGGLIGGSAGIVYVADTFNEVIRQIAADGTSTTIAGQVLVQGSTDGTGAVATFHSPTAMVRDSTGALYVADGLGTTIRRIGTDGSVTTLAGMAGSQGVTDGTGSTARFDNITSLAIDSADNIYVGDKGGGGFNASVRKVTPAGVVTTVTSGFLDIEGIAVGTDGNIYISDVNSNVIRSVPPGGGAVSTVVSINAISSVSLTGSIATMGPKKYALSGTKLYGDGKTYLSVYVLTLP